MLPEQAAAFLDAAKGDTHETLFTFLLLTGCRPSEAFALQWADVDLENGAATVSRSLCRVGGTWTFEATKTDTGERTVPLAAPLVEMLREHRASVNERRMKIADEWRDHDVVFPGPAGKPLDISAVRRRHFNKICARAGLADIEGIPAPERKGTRGPKPRPRQRIKPWFTLYSLRHTAASLMARAGIQPKVAAAVLGHADISTTLRHYTHSAEDLESTAVATLAELVSRSG
jgi:integrase